MDRRTFFGVGLGAAVLLSSGCSGQAAAPATSADPNNATLRFTWWGNDTRTKLTNQAIEAYQKANPGVTIKPEPGEWANYWDKLATQVAANDAPDIIQMDEKYIAEYGKRGALLDLEKVRQIRTGERAPDWVLTARERAKRGDAPGPLESPQEALSALQRAAGMGGSAGLTGSPAAALSKVTTAAGGETPSSWYDVCGSTEYDLVDFSNPTPAMIKDAQSKGLDLTDVRYDGC